MHASQPSDVFSRLPGHFPALKPSQSRTSDVAFVKINGHGGMRPSPNGYHHYYGRKKACSSDSLGPCRVRERLKYTGEPFGRLYHLGLTLYNSISEQAHSPSQDSAMGSRKLPGKTAPVFRLSDTHPCDSSSTRNTNRRPLFSLHRDDGRSAVGPGAWKGKKAASKGAVPKMSRLRVKDLGAPVKDIQRVVQSLADRTERTVQGLASHAEKVVTSMASSAGKAAQAVSSRFQKAQTTAPHSWTVSRPKKVQNILPVVSAAAATWTARCQAEMAMAADVAHGQMRLLGRRIGGIAAPGQYGYHQSAQRQFAAPRRQGSSNPFRVLLHPWRADVGVGLLQWLTQRVGGAWQGVNRASRNALREGMQRMRGAEAGVAPRMRSYTLVQGQDRAREDVQVRGIAASGLVAVADSGVMRFADRRPCARFGAHRPGCSFGKGQRRYFTTLRVESGIMSPWLRRIP